MNIVNCRKKVEGKKEAAVSPGTKPGQIDSHIKLNNLKIDESTNFTLEVMKISPDKTRQQDRISKLRNIRVKNVNVIYIIMIKNIKNIYGILTNYVPDFLRSPRQKKSLKLSNQTDCAVKG